MDGGGVEVGDQLLMGFKTIHLLLLLRADPHGQGLGVRHTRVIMDMVLAGRILTMLRANILLIVVWVEYGIMLHHRIVHPVLEAHMVIQIVQPAVQPVQQVRPQRQQLPHVQTVPQVRAQ